MGMEQLDVLKSRAAVMTGTGAFTLTPGEQAAIVRFVQAGGRLIIDAGGGSKAFTQSVHTQIFSQFGGLFVRRLASHVAAQGPATLKKKLYRSDHAKALGTVEEKAPRLWTLLLNNRPAIILSRADMTAGLVGYPAHRLRGYDPDTSVALMTNLLCQTVGYLGPPKPKKPAPAPAPKPSQPTKNPR